MSGAFFWFPRIKMQCSCSQSLYISVKDSKKAAPVFHGKYRRPGMKAGKH